MITITNLAQPARETERTLALAPDPVLKVPGNPPLPLVKPALETNSSWHSDLSDWRLDGIEQLRQELPGYTPTTTGANYDPTNTENSENQRYFRSDLSSEARSQGYTFKSDTDFIMLRWAGKQERGFLAKEPDRAA